MVRGRHRARIEVAWLTKTGDHRRGGRKQRRSVVARELRWSSVRFEGSCSMGITMG
jgi:hypothetical protein